MVIKKIFALIYIFLFTSMLDASSGNPNFFDNAQLHITSSPLVMPLRKLIELITPYANHHLKIKDCLANDDLQKIAQEAQTSVGIPRSRQVLLKIAEGTSFTGLNFYAATNSNGIFINQESLAFKPYGLTRHLLHHEAIHYKYNDSLMAALLAGTSCLATDTITTRLLLHHLEASPKISIISIICGIGAGLSIVKKFNMYTEHRADIQGAYATQCYKCVSQKLNYNDDSLCSHGYASNQEFEAIKKNLKEKNLLCEHHTKKPTFTQRSHT